MKFPIQHCVKCSEIGYPLFLRLLEKLQSEGYLFPSFYSRIQFGFYEYLGVNPYGDIMLYDGSDSYISIDNYNLKDNVLSRNWVLNYLGEK